MQSNKKYNAMDLVTAPEVWSFSTGTIECWVKLGSAGANAPNASVVFAQAGRSYKYVRLEKGKVVMGVNGKAKASKLMPIRAGVWYRLKIQILPSGRIAVYVNDKLIKSYTPTGGSVGRVGVWVNRAKSFFDNFVVWEVIK